MGAKRVLLDVMDNREGLQESIKHNIFVKKPFPVPRPLVPRVAPYVAYRTELNVRDALKIYRKTHDPNHLHRQKSSDTLSILGSGSSINELEQKDFDFINSTDSLALNWWGVYHDFVPDFYKFEFLGYPELNNKWIDNMNDSANKYKDTTFIFEPEHLFNVGENISESLNRLSDPIIDGMVDIRISQFFVGKNADFSPELLSYIFPTVFRDRFLHYRGSLSQALSMACFMGYENIILFGVDLNDSAYFFGEHPVWEVKERPDTDEKHATATEKRFKGIDDYIRVLAEEILPGKGIQLYIGSEQSELHPDLTYFKDTYSY